MNSMAYNKKEMNEGSISEWNEGNFKNLRLHEAQEWINNGKISPFELSDDRTKFNFQIWKSGIDILYGEGQSKYSSEEIDEVEGMKKLCETIIEIKPPTIRVTEHSIEGRKDKLIPNQENQKKIKELLEKYEFVVKKYNDDHGLSTRNKEEEDWRGL